MLISINRAFRVYNIIKNIQVWDTDFRVYNIIIHMYEEYLSVCDTDFHTYYYNKKII